MVDRVRITHELPKPSTRVIIKKPIVRFEWRGAFEGWSRNWVHRNFWRVRELFGSEDDALQECALIFVRCCRAYEGKVDNPAWLMALFKRAVANDWHTFAQKDGRFRSLPLPEPEDEIDHNPGVLSAALASGSDELKQFLTVLAEAPAEFLSLLLGDADQIATMSSDAAAVCAKRFNQRIRRLLGILNPAVDVVSELRAILE